jgi:tRNA G46 methylase TrmB
MKNMINELQKIEDYSKKIINQTSNEEINNHIQWFANCVNDYDDDKITNFYLNDEYSRKTRWDTWNEIVNLLLNNNIKNVIDIGCANGHFVYLCESKKINSFGLEPRMLLVDSYNKKFSTKKLFVSSYETFIDYLSNNEINIKFDCICILNFFHGDGHKKEYVHKFFTQINKYCNYLVISEPVWGNYGLDNLTQNFTLIDSVGYENKHKLFKLN